jgi:transmembrane sensor
MERRVTCYGRVLFNVSHNFEHPFVVKTPKQEITVLGTLFEVQDYTREDTGAVYCFSGKVSVKDSGRAPQILKARQRITVRPTRPSIVSTGDFPQAQWSSPELFFDFSDLSLDSAMDQIAQWYAMSKVEFQPGMNRKKRGTVYIGKISRYLSLEQLLSIIERNDLHFTIQDRTILVSNNRGSH